MTKIIVLFNLKDGVKAEDYELWAQTTDLPTVNALASVDKFEVFRTNGLLGGGDAPYQYVETIDVPDMDALGPDISSETMQKVAAEFQQFADNPLFMISHSIATP
ncbi:REDY-like protein HapK [Halioxenophilus sp. WMMB6]|uniref:REDY-like protein HapK n=1 Tax=Halioxenophilus sp. WMMB6 TaxID=3073815 RepID=UPI00295E8100|nr:REDY-like protein HapK [Halioxenophilus sp. WMMB6]